MTERDGRRERQLKMSTGVVVGIKSLNMHARGASRIFFSPKDNKVNLPQFEI